MSRYALKKGENFIQIPQDATVLGFDFKLSDMATYQVVNLLRDLPEQVTELDFSYADIGLRDLEELKEIIQNIPKEVTAVNFAWNKLTRNHFLAIFNALPAHVKALKYSTDACVMNDLLSAYNESILGSRKNTHHVSLDCVSDYKLKKGVPITELPLNVNSVEFDENNKLADWTTEEIIDFLQHLPKHATFLNFRFANLGSKSVEDVGEIFKHIPTTVTALDIQKNNLTREHFVALFSVRPITVKSCTYTCELCSEEDIDQVYASARYQGQSLIQAREDNQGLLQLILRTNLGTNDARMNEFMHEQNQKILNCSDKSDLDGLNKLTKELTLTLAALHSKQMQLVNAKIVDFTKHGKHHTSKAIKADKILTALMNTPIEKRGTIMKGPVNDVQIELARPRHGKNKHSFFKDNTINTKKAAKSYNKIMKKVEKEESRSHSPR